MGDLLKSAQDAVAMAQEAGAQNAWAGASRSRDVEFSLRDGKLEKVQESTSRSLSLRLYVDGRYASSSTTDLRPERLKAFVSEAVAMTRALQEDPDRMLPDPALFEGRPTEDLELMDETVRGVTREDRLAWLEAMNSKLAGADKVVSAESGVNDGHSVQAAASSNGFAGEHESTYLWMGSSVTLKDAEGKLTEAGMWGGARYRSDIPEPEAIAAMAMERGLSRMGATKGPTKKTTMVVDPSAAPSLIGRLLGSANASSMHRGRSFYKDKVGEKMVSEVLTITDNPLLKRGLASRPFDGEGIAAKPLTVFENGVFKNLYVDTYYGKKLSLSPTTGSSSNRVVKLGEKNLEQLLADAGEGIYVTSWLGGNADGTTGDFSFGIRGHLIENGKLGAPVSEMNVTGNLVDLFGQLVAVGNDPWKYSSILAPTLVFDGVDFAGA